MKQFFTKSIYLCLVVIFILNGVIQGQTIKERRRWIDEKTTTTDDPRRIPVPPGKQGPEGTLVLTGGRIFDGNGTPVRPGNVVIEGNKIKEILPPGSSAWPREAEVIDVGGKTILPGLIAMHEHITEVTPPLHDGITVLSNEAYLTLMAMEHLRWFIESGITSVRDMAAHGSVPFRLKDAVSQNRIPGPRLFAVGQTTCGTGGHSVEGNIPVLEKPRLMAEGTYDGANAWRLNIREQFNMGADLIKTTNIFNREEIAAACEEAHALGIMVTTDAHVPWIEWAIEGGLDCVEHLGVDRTTDNVIQMMAERGVACCPTICSGKEDPENMEIFRKMKAAGIKMCIGIDEGATLHLFPIPYITEMKTFVEGGYTLLEVLRAATKDSADILGMGDKLGTLEPGKLADILVVDGKPDLDLDDLAHTDLVIRDGHIVIKEGRLFVPRHTPRGQ